MTQVRTKPTSLIAALLLATLPTTAGAMEIGGTISFHGAITQPTEPLRHVHTVHPLSIAAPLRISRVPIADVLTESPTDLLDYFSGYAQDDADIVTARYH